jgi:hypothetical protein
VIIPWSVLSLSVQFAVNYKAFRVYGANLNCLYVWVLSYLGTKLFLSSLILFLS